MGIQFAVGAIKGNDPWHRASSVTWRGRIL